MLDGIVMEAIQLRKDQLKIMADHYQEDFWNRLLQHLRKVFPNDTQEMSGQLLLERARPTVNRAGEYGIEMEYDVVRFVDLTFLLGGDFDSSPETPWAGEILHDKTLTGTQKMDALWNYVQEHLADAGEISGRK